MSSPLSLSSAAAATSSDRIIPVPNTTTTTTASASNTSEEDTDDHGVFASVVTALPPVLPTTTWRCSICDLDLQSFEAYEQHMEGRKHQSKKRKHSVDSHAAAVAAASSYTRTLGILPYPNGADNTVQPVLTQSSFYDELNNGKYRNIVVLTGAGISTNAGIVDFRSPGGLFDTLKNEFGNEFPTVHSSPEYILSRRFINEYPDVFVHRIRPLFQKHFPQDTMRPTPTHHFCSWLYQHGWLKRIYTQNIDGLHTHPSLQPIPIPREYVVECHGNYQDDSLVMYEDPLPERFYDQLKNDFGPKGIKDGGATRTKSKNDGTMAFHEDTTTVIHEQTGKADEDVDLILVFGTSLQVFPFAAIPNLAKKGCARVLVNRNVHDVTKTLNTDFMDEGCDPYYGLRRKRSPPPIPLAGRKQVSTKNLWMTREGNKKWRQLLVEDDCDKFVQGFMDYHYACASLDSSHLPHPDI